MRDLTPAQRVEYSSTAEQLLTLASAMPGFISFRHYAGDDDEMFAVVEFASAKALAPGATIPITTRLSSAVATSFTPNMKSSIAPSCTGMGTNINGPCNLLDCRVNLNKQH
jgi:hypothetical protein